MKIKTDAVGKGFGKQGKKPQHKLASCKGAVGTHAGAKPSSTSTPKHPIPGVGAPVHEESKYGKARR